MQIDLIEIFLIFLLLLLNAFFAASEIAVISSSKVKIEQYKERGLKSASVLLKLIEDPSYFLATIQVGITLAGFLASATAAVGLSQYLSSFFKEIGFPSTLANSLGVVIVTLIISYFTLIFGELVPKRLAMHWPEQIALKVARPINFIAKLTSPLIRFLTFSTNLVVRIFGGKLDYKEKEITENEIRLYIREHRTLPIEEKRMIEGVFNFGDQVLRQVMVPRTEIKYLSANEKVKDAIKKVCSSNYTSFPVFRKDYDDIVGVVTLRNMVCKCMMDEELKIEEITVPTIFVPETKSTVDLLKEFRSENLEMAIVVDEYGGVVGLVTLEDLVDEIIGDIIQENTIRKTSEGQWLVRGDTPISEIIESFDLRKINLNNDFETIAGFILKLLGHLPQEGEAIFWEGYNFQVKEMGRRRIKTVLITKEK